MRLFKTGVISTLLLTGMMSASLAADLDNVAPSGSGSVGSTDDAGAAPAPLVPGTVAFQGFLTDDVGAPIDGPVSLALAIFGTAAGGAPLWSEVQAGVSVSEGIFAIALGDVNPIPPAIFDDPTTYLAIRVDGEPELTPRTQLRTSPYAFKAQDADNLGGIGSNGYVKRSGDSMVGVLGLDGGVEGLFSGGVTEVVDSETDVTLRHYFLGLGGDSDSWAGRNGRVILSFNGSGIPAGGGSGVATVLVGGVPTNVDIAGGGIRPYTYIVETGPLSSSGIVDVLVRANSAADPVMVRSIILETDNEGAGGGAHNTLDQAYDEGGAGAGRTILADSGAVYLRGAGGLVTDGPVDLGVSAATSGNLELYSGTSASAIARMYDFGQGGALDYFDETGAYTGAFEPDGNGSGGWFWVVGGEGTGGMIVDGYTGADNGMRVSIDGATSDFTFDTNVAGNSSTILPINAIDRTEIFDEPGMSQGKRDGDFPVTSAGAMEDVITTTITIPTSGYIFLTASAQARFASGTTGAYMAIQIDENPGGTTDPNHYYYVGNNTTVTSAEWRPVQTQRTYFKTAGTYTFRFEAQNVEGDTFLWNASLAAMFMPTSYGTVQERVADSEIGSFSDVTYTETGTNGPGTVSQRVASVDLRELEIRVAEAEAEAARLREELIRAELAEQEAFRSQQID